MLCEKCKKRTATFHSTTNINGIITERHLCNECSKTEKLDFSEFENFLTELEKTFFMPSPFILNSGAESFLDYDDNVDERYLPVTGKKGYSNFDSYINDILKGVKIEMPKKEKDKILKLRDDLRLAVDKEDYESASKIKKEIEKLTNEDKRNEDKEGK